MELKVVRYKSEDETTLGHLYINGKHQCYTLEDEFRSEKVHGETRIPEGTYKITLRNEGGFDRRYRAKFGTKFHKGMLWVRDVPNFEYILIHIGNTDDDTAGCLLVGSQPNRSDQTEGKVSASTDAYKIMYPKVRDALLKGEEVTITYETIG